MIGLLAAVALTGATVHSGTGPPLEDATILIEGSRITAVGTHVVLPGDVELHALRGAIVTPGLIDVDARLGLTDVVLEPSSVEGTTGKKSDPVRAALRVEDSFNPRSFVIPHALAGGLTSAVIMPSGGLISGQAIWVDLGVENPIRQRSAALRVNVTRQGKEAGGRARAFLRLREVLDDARLFRANRGPFIANKLRDLSVSALDLEVLARALDRKLLVVFEVNRAADIRAVLRLIREHRLRAVLLGAAEGWLIAEEIAAAKVPVVMNPIDNLPTSFDKLEVRGDGALRLQRMGVRVAFSVRNAAHFAHRLRWLAGNAVAAGYPRDEALAAITRIPAEIFDVSDAGTLEPGKLANLVVWNGDPFELGTWPTSVYVRGQRFVPRTRQDLLTERYRSR